MSRLSDLKRDAKEVGLVVETYSPGGVPTRYRFINANAPENQHGYFRAMSRNVVYTASGIANAELFLTGFWTGYYSGFNAATWQAEKDRQLSE
jgi:hypothetical protein